MIQLLTKTRIGDASFYLYKDSQTGVKFMTFRNRKTETENIEDKMRIELCPQNLSVTP